MQRRSFLKALAALPIVGRLITPEACACACEYTPPSHAEVIFGPPLGECTWQPVYAEVSILNPCGGEDVYLCPVKFEGVQYVVDMAPVEQLLEESDVITITGINFPWQKLVLV